MKNYASSTKFYLTSLIQSIGAGILGLLSQNFPYWLEVKVREQALELVRVKVRELVRVH
jgi:hypothetical protein